MGTQICSYMRTGMTNPGVRIAETLGILVKGKKAWGRKRGVECTENHIKCRKTETWDGKQ